MGQINLSAPSRARCAATWCSVITMKTSAGSCTKNARVSLPNLAPHRPPGLHGHRRSCHRFRETVSGPSVRCASNRMTTTLVLEFSAAVSSTKISRNLKSHVWLGASSRSTSTRARKPPHSEFDTGDRKRRDTRPPHVCPCTWLS